MQTQGKYDIIPLKKNLQILFLRQKEYLQILLEDI